MRFQDNSGDVLLDWPRNQNITPHGWHASYRLHQPDLEKLLRKQLGFNNNATQVLGCQLLSITEHADHTELYCTHKTTNESIQFKASFVVGCDGANSLVRKTICDEVTDFGFRERWLVVDLILKKDRPDLGDHSIQFCDIQRPMTYCRSPGMRRRWEISVLKNETDAEISSESKIWELLSRWISPEDAQLERKSVYTFGSVIARQWHSGRLLIAGDAAHLTPPFMGQGMCAGVRDASNLAWKLTTVIKDNICSALLKSYQQERSPHIQYYIETAIRLGELINSMDRKRALQMAKDQVDGKATIQSEQPKLGSSMYLHDLKNSCAHPVGQSFAQTQLDSGMARLDDLIGYKHALITRERLQHSLSDSFVALSTKDYPALVSDLDKLGVNAVWVRPDRYIAAVADSAEKLLSHIPKTLR